ncbi:hypothetical protein GQX73_g10446 [Xylaria multiplex]|uniref:C2H2-type domain-containing protein n=1 Tax=Xylaria multiplex TaxID=323545 RepID=A0A7C8MI85_9PEZI|nr:hypothetical protein GQX73_g10446 [Xylaria multiplex]
MWPEDDIQFDFTIEDAMFAGMEFDLLDPAPYTNDPPDLAAPPTSPINSRATASYGVLGDDEAWTLGESSSEPNSVVNSPPQLGVLSSPLGSLRPHVCTMCTNATIRFKHKKDLNRHIGTVHPTGNEPFYCCRCAKLNTRKDNYLRHLRSCKKQHPYAYYLCKCLSHYTSKEEHMHHVTNCHYGFGRTGRPSAS